MEERDPELPVATMRPVGILGRLAALRGAIARWLRAKRRALDGRSLPLILTSLVFCTMMLAMSHVADRAQRAGAAIDEVHREERSWRHDLQHRGLLFRGQWTTTDPWSSATPDEPYHDDDATATPGAGAAATAVGRNAALFYIVAGSE